MLRRTSLICFEVAVGIVVVTGLLFVATAWRLSQGPVSLRFMLSYAEDILHDENSRVRVDVDDLFLTWAGWERALDVRAEGVGFRTAEGQRLARVREISVSLSFRALLQGVLAPTSLEVIRPRLLVVRGEDGGIELGMADAEAEARDVDDMRGDLLPLLLDGLSGTPRRDSSLRFLNTVRVLGGALRVDDRQLGVTWGARYADLSLSRASEGLEVTYDLELDLPDAPTLRGDMLYRKDKGRIEGALSFARLNTAELAVRMPRLAGLGAFAASLRGDLSFGIGPGGRIERAEFMVRAGPGRLEVPDVEAEPVEFRAISLAGRLNRDPDQVQISRGHVDLAGDTAADLTAVVTRVGQIAAISATTRIGRLPVNDIARYWPRNVGSGARSWVIPNIREGEVRDVTANLTGRIALDGDEAGAVTVDSVNGSFSVAGASVNYLDPMPVITDASATATFSMKRFDFAVHSGRVGELGISDAAVNIWDVGAPREMLAVSAMIRGPVAAALGLVAHPRLKLLSRVGLEPAGAKGSHATRLKVTLPLLDKLRDDEIQVNAVSRIGGLALSNVLKGEGISGGTVDLSVDNAGLRATGDADYGGSPVRFVWAENFAEAALVRRTLQASLTLDSGLRSRFGVEFPDILGGPVDARLDIEERRNDERTLAADLDLKAATLTVPGLDWTKPTGQAGTANATVQFRGDRLVGVPEISVAAGDLSASGSVAFAGDGATVRQARLDDFRLGPTAFAATAVRQADGTLEITASGAGFDARPLLSRIAEEGETPDLPPFGLKADFEQVWINDGPPASRAQLTLRRDAQHWRRVMAELYLPGTDKVSSLKIETGKESGDAMQLYSADASSLVRALRISDAIRGGEIEARAVRAPGEGNPWKGAAEMKRFRVAGAPNLARILTLASLTGISDVVSGKEGISFDRMDMPFEFADGVVRISEMRAVGSELGITASGSVNLRGDAIDIRGTIVPAYTINSLIGRIPLIGTLITGEKGGGIFAASYDVTGPVDEPKISVNPLSTLAPGFLRKLLEGRSAPPSDAPGSDESPDGSSAPGVTGE